METDVWEWNDSDGMWHLTGLGSEATVWEEGFGYRWRITGKVERGGDALTLIEAKAEAAWATLEGGE